MASSTTTTAAGQQVDDDPRQSSAALCISFELLGESFGPEFTHQCFPGEWIRGYRPKITNDTMTTTSTQQQQQHSTHVHHQGATHELHIHIKLSPSCRQSQVNVQVQRYKKRQETTTVRRVSKRPRLIVNNHQECDDTTTTTTPHGGADAVVANDNNDNHEQDEQESVTSSPENDDDSDYLLMEQSEEEPNDDCYNANAGTTRTRRMPVDEIMERCGKALPPPMVGQEDWKNIGDDFLNEPIGTILHEYQRNKVSFVISLADGSDHHAVQYHNHVQTLASWFIETADSVNIASQDNNGGYWKVLYLFRKHHNHNHYYSLAGYMSIFHFESPFKRPKAGIVARICQALILPPYQRMGHGKMLLKTLYQMAANSDDKNIVEINVEDPAPSFVALRNRVDYKLFRESITACSSSGGTEPPWLDSIYTMTTTIQGDDFFRGVSDQDAVAAGAVARITPRQVQICHELYKLSFLLKNVENEEQEWNKRYRIMVKRRLARVHREELGACRSKEEKQALLEKMFDKTLKHYKSVLKSV